MRILLFIDSLGSGGAQRQIVNLACGLNNRGHDVEIVVYHSEFQFFKALLDNSNIFIHHLPNKRTSPFKFIFTLIKLICFSRFQAVVSFLDAPNFYAEAVKFLSFSCIKLIVSERSSIHVEEPSFFNSYKRYFHFFANYVVTNSHSHYKFLSSIPFLTRKTVCIYNGYDLSLFDFRLPSYWHSPKELNLLVVGRIDHNKNGSNLLKGIILFYQKYGKCPRLSWAGRQPHDSYSVNERHIMDQLLDQYPEVSANWIFLNEVNNIPELISESHALLHVSLCEGLSNAVCEALISGRPVIASSISDHPFLVEDGVRGFLCNPSSPSSICSAIEKLYALPKSAYLELCRASRSYGVSHLALAKMVSRYEQLFK